MQSMSRRKVLKTALKIGAGMVAFVPAMKSLTTDVRARGAAPAEVGASPPSNPPPGVAAPPSPPATVSPRHIIENYAGGVVLSVTGSTITLRTDSGSRAAQIELHLSSSTRIWEGSWGSSLPIEGGDHIDAWGTPQGTNVLAVEKMWVNIVNLMGTVESVKQAPGGLQVQHQDSRTGTHSVVIDHRTIVDRQESPEVTYSSAIVLHPGQFLQIIGLRLKGGTVRATRLLY